MGSKTPTSSLSAIELLVNRIWYRSRARIRGIRSKDAPPRPDTVPLSPIMMLPQEIIETVIAHLIYDLSALLSCSLTCYSWYIATVPHLHPTLITSTTTTTFLPSRKNRWPNPIRSMYTLGLLPFVKIVVIHSYYKEFSPKLFNSFTLHKFSGLTNVRELRIDNLDIPGFMPKIQRYFHSFLPTLKHLYLTSPKGSNRQIIFFIGLFQHLEDLMLGWRQFYENSPEEDLTLVPPFAPPLRGWLAVCNWEGGGFFQDMVHLFERIRFNNMCLFNVGETRFLLSACAKTLLSLQLHLSDPLAMTSLRNFDLSNNKSLQVLCLPACFIDDALQMGMDHASMLLKYALSTIRSIAFSRVCVSYGGHSNHFCAVNLSPHSRKLEPSDLCQKQFELLREVRQVWDFQLVLCLMVLEHKEKSAMSKLKAAVAAEKARGGFNDLFPEPLVTSIPSYNSSACQ